MSRVNLTDIWKSHEKECAVCHYTVEGPCTVAVLMAEVGRLRDEVGRNAAIAIERRWRYSNAEARVMELEEGIAEHEVNERHVLGDTKPGLHNEVLWSLASKRYAPVPELTELVEGGVADDLH